MPGFIKVPADGEFEGTLELLRTHLREGRQAKGRCPGCEQPVLGSNRQGWGRRAGVPVPRFLSS